MFIVTGAVAFDHILSFSGRFSDHILPEKLHVINISVVTDTLKRHFGGTGGNQAYTLGLLGMKPVLLASAGTDFGEYDEHLRHAGVNTSYVGHSDKQLSATAFALYDRDDNQIWGFAKNAMSEAVHLHLSQVGERVHFALITPDDYKAVEQYVSECCRKHIPFAFDPAFDIPKLEPAMLKKGTEHAEILFGNDYEISQLKKITGLSHEKLIQQTIVVTTLANKGSIIEKGEEKLVIPPAKAHRVVDPAGAGDAYRAGFLAGYLRKLDLGICGRMGSLAAVYALEHEGTIEHTFTIAEFKKRYKENFGSTLRFPEVNAMG